MVERKNQTVVEMTQSFLKSGKLPIRFRAEAVATSVHLINISPTQEIHNKTPFEMWHGAKLRVGHLKVFGSIVFALIPS